MVSGLSGRVLGLDAGERRIGVAISDPGGSFALPLNSILADGSEFDRLREVVSNEDISDIVIGLPLSLSGESSAQTERARAFAARTEERLGLPVHLWDERLSTQEALRLTQTPASQGRGRKARGKGGQAGPDTDALAASIILQAFLDSRRLERS